MSQLQERHYKDTMPEKTINRIKNILDDMDIPMIDTWFNVMNNGCYSLRTTVAKTNFGTNGKGVSEKYTMASAYAEFMERLQNNALYLSLDSFDLGNGFHRYVDEKQLTTRELLEQVDPVSNYLMEKLEFEEKTIEEKVCEIDKLFTINQINFGTENRLTVPFYNVKNQKVYYYSYDMFSYIYGTSGMCAGNTPEEAIVQGLSEIVERYVQKKIMSECQYLPNVPEEEIAKYPEVWKIYSKLKSHENYKVAIKDCTFGGKYPVAAFVCVKEDAGTFGVKFGCHPDFGIAMERTLTEAFQGKDLEEFTKSSTLTFNKSEIADQRNIYNSFTYGIAKFPSTLTDDLEEKPFIAVQDTSKLSNKEILKNMEALIFDEGYEIMVRDVSYLGFPSYFIIIPGMSEVNELFVPSIRAANTAATASKWLRNPSLLTRDKIKYISKVVDFYSTSYIENHMGFQYQIPISHRFLGDDGNMGTGFLAVMCSIALEDYGAAMHNLQFLEGVFGVQGIPWNPLYSAMESYCDAKANKLSHKEAIKVLKVGYDDEIIEKIEKLSGKINTGFENYYPSFPCPNCEECDFQENCSDKKHKEILGKLQKKQLENFPDQNLLKQLFI